MIINANKSNSESRNWKLDWAQSSKNCHKISPQPHVITQFQPTRVFTCSQCTYVKNQKVGTRGSEATIFKDLSNRNKHLNKSHKVFIAKQSAVNTCVSIPLHNRCNVLNNADYCPKSALTDTICEQEMVCLHVDSKSERANVENNNVGKSLGSNKATKNVKMSVENNTHQAVDYLRR